MIALFSQSNGVLFKEQLLEWRGWTTLLIVGLEYSDMTEVLQLLYIVTVLTT